MKFTRPTARRSNARMHLPCQCRGCIFDTIDAQHPIHDLHISQDAARFQSSKNAVVPCQGILGGGVDNQSSRSMSTHETTGYYHRTSETTPQTTAGVQADWCVVSPTGHKFSNTVSAQNLETLNPTGINKPTVPIFIHL